MTAKFDPSLYTGLLSKRQTWPGFEKSPEFREAAEEILVRRRQEDYRWRHGPMGLWQDIVLAFDDYRVSRHNYQRAALIYDQRRSAEHLPQSQRSLMQHLGRSPYYAAALVLVQVGLPYASFLAAGLLLYVMVDVAGHLAASTIARQILRTPVPPKRSYRQARHVASLGP